MPEPFRPSLATTAIGSVPFLDVEGTVRRLLGAGLTIPFWPQFARRHPLCMMIPQFAILLPGAAVSPDGKSVYVDAGDKYELLARFYESYLSEDLGPFALPEHVAAGLYEFERQADGRTWPYVKGHVTGPITLSTSTLDQNGMPIYADAELRDATVKALVRNAEWQVERLSRLASEGVVIFIDEPVLAAFGSSALASVSADDVTSMVGEVAAAVEAAGGVSGIHVCGNSGWDVVIGTGVRVLAFDAYEYGQSLALYPEAVAGLIARGGSLAWGIVPTKDGIRQADVGSLVARFEACIGALARKGLDEAALRERSLLTPSCGTGPMEPRWAERVFELLPAVQRELTR